MLPQRCVTGCMALIFAQDCSPAQSGRYAVPIWVLPLPRLPNVLVGTAHHKAGVISPKLAHTLLAEA